VSVLEDGGSQRDGWCLLQFRGRGRTRTLRSIKKQSEPHMMTVNRDVEFWVGLRSCRYKVVVVVLASGCRLSERYLQSLDLMTHIVAVRGCAFAEVPGIRYTGTTAVTLALVKMKRRFCNSTSFQADLSFTNYSYRVASSGNQLPASQHIHMSLIRYPRSPNVAHNPF